MLGWKEINGILDLVELVTVVWKEDEWFHQTIHSY